MGKSPLSQNFHHVGMIVHDLDKTVEYYESLGIGPFTSWSVEVVERKLRGKVVTDVKNKIKMVRVGPTTIELTQPVAGKESIWREFLEKYGEGVQHLAFVVEDIEKAKAEMVKRGLNIVYTAKFKPRGGAVYLEDKKAGGIMFELFQRPSD